ncbi:GNAT family N-acetyltransferase [Geminicoccus flavidas]|uniref:GNAT family N-acetyltransferase n=1 Tax=Geminicoccus flavidas TaxID=2506407 RepID=UPI001F41B64B|nr:GNAT family protein [Geminicoccus flavidas]
MTEADGHEPVCRRPLSTAPVTPLPPVQPPARAALAGRTVRLEPLEPGRHGPALFVAGHGPDQAERWRFMAYGPFADGDVMQAWLQTLACPADPMFFAICDPAGRALGMASYLNIHSAGGSIEIGHIWFGSELRRRTAATEAIHLLIRNAITLGFRRIEWKCDAANLPSRRAARRYGFRHEGIFYRHLVVKGRNRDTAWYSILAEEWPALDAAFTAWLDPGNFDEDGHQRRPLMARQPLVP